MDSWLIIDSQGRYVETQSYLADHWQADVWCHDLLKQKLVNGSSWSCKGASSARVYLRWPVRFQSVRNEEQKSPRLTAKYEPDRAEQRPHRRQQEEEGESWAWWGSEAPGSQDEQLDYRGWVQIDAVKDEYFWSDQWWQDPKQELSQKSRQKAQHGLKSES